MASAEGPPVSVEILQAFGSLSGTALRDPVLFCDDTGNILVQPVGRHLVFRHMDTGETNFVLAGDHVEGLTACAISRDRTLFATCERRSAAPHARVSVYSLREVGNPRLVKAFEPMPGSTARLTGLAFSEAGPNRYLCAAVASGAEATVLVYDWEREKLMGKSKVSGPVDRVAFSPEPDTLRVSASGPHTLRLLLLRDATSKIRESSLKAMPAFSGLDEGAVRIVDHAWADPGAGTVVACVSSGPLYLLSSHEMNVTHIIDTAFQHPEGHGATMPACVRCFSQGFIVGGGDGMVAVWEKVDPLTAGLSPDPGAAAPQEFQHARTVRVSKTASPVCSMDIAGGEESLVVGFRSAEIGFVPMQSLFMTRVHEIDCALISGGFHSGPISGLDMAVQRPLVLSVGHKDGSVRLWNYVTRVCELCWRFGGDLPSGAALHPFGYFAAVGFAEKLCFFQVLAKEMRLHSEVPLRGAKLLRFANGGHYLAAAQGRSVHVFAIGTLSKVATLQGHVRPVSALCFDPDDHVLWTCSQDGGWFQWDTQTWTKAEEHVTGGGEYLSASSGANREVCCSLVQSGRAVLRKFNHGALESDLEVRGARLTAVCHCPGSNAVFAGTSAGVLRVYASLAPNSGYNELGLHVGNCSAVCISPDGKTLLTAGDDGTIFVLGVNGPSTSDESLDRTGEIEGRVLGSEVVLVKRAEMQRQAEECERYRLHNTKLKATLAAEAQRLEEECLAKVAEARQKDQAEIMELTRRADALEQASATKERESRRIMQSMGRSHAEAAGQLKNLYEKKVEYEAEKYLSLKEREALVEEQINGVRMQVEQELEEQRIRAKMGLQRRLAEKEMEVQKHKDHIAYTTHRFDAILDIEGDDHDVEVAALNMKRITLLKEQEQSEVKLRTEQETLLKGLEEMEKDRERIEREQQDATNQIKSLKEQTDELSRTLSSLKVEGRERDATLADKELKIESYQVKVNTLKKFKHVLDKKLAEVTESLQPKDRMIDQLNEHLRELEREFERQLVDERSMEGAIEQKKQHAAILTAEAQKLRDQIKARDRIITSYTTDLHGLVTGGMEERQWPQEIRRIYHAHVCGEKAGEDRLPLEVMQQQMRQAERRVASLAVLNGQVRDKTKADIQRKAHESAMLVHELNELRVQKRSLQSNIKSLQSKLERLGQGQGQRALEGPGQQPALEDKTRRPDSAPQAPSAPGASTLRSMPRTPSGSLPGPRQQQSSSRASHESPVTKERRQVRQRSVPPLGAKRSTGILTLQRSPEDDKRIQSLVVTADLNRQQLQMQQTENKMLRSQIETLLEEQKKDRKDPTPNRLTAQTAGRRAPRVAAT